MLGSHLGIKLETSRTEGRAELILAPEGNFFFQVSFITVTGVVNLTLESVV